MQIQYFTINAINLSLFTVILFFCLTYLEKKSTLEKRITCSLVAGIIVYLFSDVLFKEKVIKEER